MKHFLIDGNIHAYDDDGSQDAFIPPGAVPLNDAEVDTLLNPPPTTADLLARTADRRWQREIGGITVGDLVVATDDRSKLLLQGARTAADADPDHVEGWKTSTGVWIDLDAPTIIGLSNAVRAHVSACFAIERSVADQIDAGTITTLAEVESAFT